MTNSLNANARTEPIAQDRSPAIDEAIAQAQQHLDAGKPDKALAAVNKAHLKSPWITNAIAVCQIRRGNATEAVEILRHMVLHGHIQLRADVPAIFKANFAAALLAAGNFEGFEATMREVGPQAHPAALKFQDAYERWKSSLSLWDKLKLMAGGSPKRTFVSETPLGELE